MVSFAIKTPPLFGGGGGRRTALAALTQSGAPEGGEGCG